MENFLKEFHTKSENPRNKILLTSKLEEIEVKYTEMIYRKDVFSEGFIKIFEEVHRAANNVLNRLPNTSGFDSIRLGLLSISNRALVEYSSFFMHASIEKIYSSANILAELLVGLTRIEDLPEIPDHTSPNYEKIALRHISIIVSTSELFAIAIQIIPIIEKGNLITWTNEVLTRFDLLVEVFNRIDCHQIFDRYQKLSKTEILIFNISSCIRHIVQVFKLLEYLYEGFGTDWPDEILVTNHFPSKDIEGIYVFTRKTNEMLTQLEEILNLFDPQVLEKYQGEKGEAIFEDAKKVRSLFQQMMVKYQILGAYENRMLRIPDLDSSIELLEAKIRMIVGEGMLTQGSSLIDWTYVMYIYDDLIAFYTIRAMLSGDYLTFRSHIDTFLMQSFFDMTELFSETKFNAILADLFVAISFQVNPDLSRFKELLEYELRQLHPLSHMNISYKLLIQIIRSKLDEDIEDIAEQLDTIYEQYFARGNLHHLSAEFKKYIATLKSCLRNQPPSWNSLKKRKKRRMAELRSWVIPDFAKLPERKLRPSLRYLPFNLITDRIQ